MIQMTEQATYSVPTMPVHEPSCTPVRPRSWVHWHRFDFVEINRGDKINADALRYFENLTNQRIRDLRKKFAIPDGYLPSEDDLWVDEDEATLRQIAASTGTYGRTAYMRCLREHTGDQKRASLIERGFLRVRWIARLSSYGVKPTAPILLDARGAFINTDRYGNYSGDDGNVHNAVVEGHYNVRQILYEIEAVNRAIAALDFLDPPPPKPPWPPIDYRHKQGGGGPVPQHHSSAGTAENNSISTGRQGGKSTDGLGIVLSVQQDNTARLTLSTETGQKIVQKNTRRKGRSLLSVNPDVLRVAPWNETTLIGLVALILAVPDPEQCDEDEWNRNWLEPAQWLFEICATGNDPRYAWPQIPRHIFGILCGPTFLATKATRPFTPNTLTLRHVVGFNRESGLLDGHTWRAVEEQLNEANNWWPEPHLITAYDGPPLDSGAGYEAGYAAIETAPAVEEQPGELIAVTGVVEVTAGDELAAADTSPSPSVDDSLAPESLSRAEAEALVLEMIQDSPSLILSYLEISADHWLVSAQYADEQWIDFGNAARWRSPSPEVAQLIDQAARYGCAQLPRQAMSCAEAEEVAQEIAAQYPGIRIELKELAQDDVVLRIEYMRNGWQTFKTPEALRNPAPATLRMLSQAAQYGRAQSNRGDDAQGDTS